MPEGVEQFTEELHQSRVQEMKNWLSAVTSIIGVPPSVSGIKILFEYDDGAELDAELTKMEKHI